MGMQWLEGELRASQDPEDLKLADQIAERLKTRGQDILVTVDNLPALTHVSTWQDKYLEMMVELVRSEKTREISDQLEREKRIRGEYKESPHTPELLTHIWTEVHADLSRKWDLKYTVEPCRASAEVIQALEQQGRMAIYIPRRIYEYGKGWVASSHDTLYNQQHIKDPPGWLAGFRDEFKSYGWLHTEAAVDTPYTGTNEEELRGLIDSSGLLPMGLNPYEITSYFLTFMHNKALDKTFTHSRLLSSTVNREVMCVGHRNDWSLEYFTCDPNYKTPNLGGRTVGVLDETTVIPQCKTLQTQIVGSTRSRRTRNS